MKIALIPARGGSKRIPRKNIRPFAGKPAIANVIETLQKSALFDRIIVSTDDAEIAAVAKQAGADVPFMRPADISDDYATTLDVVKHGIEWAKGEGLPLSALCCVYPVNPFLQADDLKNAYALMQANKAKYSFPVAEYAHPIQRAIRIRHEDGRAEMFQPDMFTKRTQDLEHAYHDAGQFYWGEIDAFLQKLPLFADYAVPYRIPSWRVVDIDTEEDWTRAELIYKALYANG